MSRSRELRLALPVTAATKAAAIKGKQEEEPGNREGEKESAVQAKFKGTNGLAICCLTPKYQSLWGVNIKPARSAVPTARGQIW